MYEEGDVLWGFFPRADKRRGAHPALVVARLGPAYVAIIGTTHSVGRESVDGQLAVSPDAVDARTWSATGLKEATGFDFKAGRMAILTDTPKYGEEQIGSVTQDPLWKQALRANLPILVNRLRKELDQR